MTVVGFCGGRECLCWKFCRFLCIFNVVDDPILNASISLARECHNTSFCYFFPYLDLINEVEYFVLVVEPTEETHQISLVSSIFLLTSPFCEVKTQNVVLYKDNQIFLFWKVNITKIQLFFRIML